MINQRIQPDKQNVTKLVSCLNSGEYFTDNTFQRRLIWTEKQKIRLIETVLIDYPMPEIYMWQQAVDTDTGHQRHSIIDGQQRLNTLAQFMRDEFNLTKTHLDDANQEESYAGMKWSELGPDDRRKILNYGIVVRVVPEDVSKEEIVAIFKRLNEADRSLNPQEFRNADFNGKFIKASEEVADLQEFKRWGLFTDSQIRRMADVEFASALLVYFRKGIVTDTQSNMNDVYDEYNDVYREKTKDISRFKYISDYMNKVLAKDEQLPKFFLRPNHLYSLFVVCDLLADKKITQKAVAGRLGEFVRLYKEAPPGDEDMEKEDKRITNFREGVSSRTRSKQRRELRVEALTDWILEQD